MPTSSSTTSPVVSDIEQLYVRLRRNALIVGLVGIVLSGISHGLLFNAHVGVVAGLAIFWGAASFVAFASNRLQTYGFRQYKFFDAQTCMLVWLASLGLLLVTLVAGFTS